MQKIYFIATLIAITLFCGYLLLDRHHLNHSSSKFSDMLEKKDNALQQQRLQHENIVKDLNSKIQLHQNQFHFVMPFSMLEKETDLPEENVPAKMIKTEYHSDELLQYYGEQELVPLARTLAEEIKKERVSARNIIKTFCGALDSRLGKTIFYKTKNHTQQLVDIRAALLEAICVQLGYESKTALCWDMNTMEYYFKTTVKSPSVTLDLETLCYGTDVKQENSQHLIVTQDKPVSVLIPFRPISLNNNDKCMLLSDIHTIPVGGLYLHRIDVIRHPSSNATEWELEYEFQTDEQKTDEQPLLPNRILQNQTMLNAIGLTPGSPALKACVSKGIQTFRIPFIRGRSSVLIVGNTPVMPIRITARSVDK